MKSAINLIFVLIGYVLIGSMESNAMSIKTGLISCCVAGLVALLVNRKKSAVSRKYNGQAQNGQQQKCTHKLYTKEGRVSSYGRTRNYK